MNHGSILEVAVARFNLIRKESVAAIRRSVAGETPPYNRGVRWFRYLAAALTVMAVVWVLRSVGVVNAGAAAPLLFLDVVVAARFWGTGPALCAAALGSVAYSYYFLPPEGFGIEDPEDWVAFITFSITAMIAGELASRAERRAAEAQAGRQEIGGICKELKCAFKRASEAE